MSFLDKHCSIDSYKLIDKLVWNEFSNSFRALFNNKYVSTHFGELHHGKIDEENLNILLIPESERSFSELLNGNTPNLLSMIFSRLYILRNQLIHRGATWNGKVKEVVEQRQVLLVQEYSTHPEGFINDMP